MVSHFSQNRLKKNPKQSKKRTRFVLVKPARTTEQQRETNLSDLGNLGIVANNNVFVRLGN